jgi:hypothetical protein
MFQIRGRKLIVRKIPPRLGLAMLAKVEVIYSGSTLAYCDAEFFITVKYFTVQVPKRKTS